MIIGVDHIAFTCPDLDNAVSVFKDAGYQVKFIDRDVPNPEAKKPLLSEYKPLHSLAFCQGAEGIAVELIDHGTTATGRGAYTPEFNRMPENNPGMFANFAISDDDAEPDAETQIPAVILPCKNLKKCCNFWEILGFRNNSISEDYVKLSFRAMLPQWSLQLKLKSSPATPAPAMLDSPGFPCLALLSTNIEEDIRRMISSGATDAAGPFPITVDGKELQLAMMRGLEDEIIELIQFKR